MPDTDYYQVLNLPRNASDFEINNAYRRLALKYHPDNTNNTNLVTNPGAGGITSLSNTKQAQEQTFRLIAEAYTVLSDPTKRARFDMYGERGLKDGTMEEIEYRGFQYVGDPYDLFFRFFGESSPAAAMLGEVEGKFNLAPRALQNSNSNANATNLELRCTLDELYRGAIKSQKVERQRFSADTMKSYTDVKTLTLQIGPGWKQGTRLCFKGEGNQIHPTSSTASDVIFTVTEQPHEKFERIMDSYDLLYIHKVSLLEALSGHVINLQLLDESTLNLHVPESVSPGYEKRILEHGLQKEDGTYGDLVVRWDIQFPGSLSLEQKGELKKILKK